MVKWDTLAYQPYFSMTATNVAYGFWSHDIVGPSAANVEDLELYTRWLQWGAYSGVLRSHDRGMSAGDCAATFPPTLTSSTCGVVRPWNVPLNFFEANQKALQRRAQLLPYVYTLARETFDKGLGPLRPMYYEFPELTAAYGATQFGDQPQYFFGGDMIVSPIVAPASENSSYLASKEWWIPPGTWVDHVLGSVIEGSKDGSTYLSSLYALDEIPVIMKAGAIVPTSLEGTNGVIGAASRQYSKLAFDVYPHANEGATTVYMDDGETTAYLNSDGYAFLDLAYARSGDGNSIEFNATYDCCIYPGQPEDIAITLRLVSMPPLAKVSAGGQNLDFRFERYASNSPGTWTYNGAEATLILQTTLSQLTKSMTITFSVPPASVKLDGIQGEILRANKAKQALDVIRKTPGSHQSGFGQLDILSTLGDVLSYTANDPDQWTEEVSKREAKLSAAIDEVQKINLPLPKGQRRLDFVRALLKLP